MSLLNFFFIWASCKISILFSFQFCCGSLLGLFEPMLPQMWMLNGVYFLPIYTGFCMFHAFAIYFGYAFAIYAKCVHSLNTARLDGVNRDFRYFFYITYIFILQLLLFLESSSCITLSQDVVSYSPFIQFTYRNVIQLKLPILYMISIVEYDSIFWSHFWYII